MSHNPRFRKRPLSFSIENNLIDYNFYQIIVILYRISLDFTFMGVYNYGVHFQVVLGWAKPETHQMKKESSKS